MSINKKSRNWTGIFLILMALLTIIFDSALAEGTGGAAVDFFISKFDEFLEEIPDVFPEGSYSISTDFILGKAGNVFIDLDDGEVRMIGKASYRTYSFKDIDAAFSLFVGGVLYGIDTSDATKYGVNVYYTKNDDTRALSETEISTLSAQFISALN